MLVDSVGQAIATEVPLRLSAAELRVMALRQQQQIDSQHKLLTAKEQRLRFLKTQGSPNFISNVEEEKLRRLRDRVETQENKLRQLRALRGQVDLQKTYNVTLNNDLNSIRALFSEKEKELSLAVAKVDALTKQLEELRQDRRCALSGISTNATVPGQQISLTSIRELEKLRRELMYRNQLSIQQDARLHFQRAALQQKQAELKSVDQRIYELQIRLQKRKASNLVQTNSANIIFDQSTQQSPILTISQSTRDCENNKIALKIKPSTNVYPGHRIVPRSNIAAVEPFIHTPQSYSSESEKPINSLDKSATGAENNLMQCIKQAKHSAVLSNTILSSMESIPTDSDEKKLAQQKLVPNLTESNDLVINIANKNDKQLHSEINECDSEKFIKYFTSKDAVANKENEKTAQTIDALNNSVMTRNVNGSNNFLKFGSTDVTHSTIRYKSLIPSGNSVAPYRKPISSVAPTSLLQPPSSVKRPKINMVAPNIVASNEESRPALPPKPSKSIQQSNENTANTSMPKNASSKSSLVDVSDESHSALTNLTGLDSQPIKAKPLTIRKQPLCEQPKLKSTNTGIKAMQNVSRRKEIGQLSLMSSANMDPLFNNQKSLDTEANSALNLFNYEKAIDDSKRRNKQIVFDQRKIKLSRRVSFDPLALLLDASLEGELELVKKTAIQVSNPSAANDEGITALHNAICAGHFEIVKFLVDLGCDVNAQDSDGWTPLHCAASCNNLTMVKFLVESGACLFASTLSDHETPAEKCEEDEEGFDGCSEYLYSIQEKLGILNNGEVYAVFSYDAQQVDELSFKINDRLIILRKGDDAEREWWWAKNETNVEGYVPRNLLGLYPRIAMNIADMPD